LSLVLNTISLRFSAVHHIQDFPLFMFVLLVVSEYNRGLDWDIDLGRDLPESGVDPSVLGFIDTVAKCKG
jgi:hypothetical protein